MGGSSFLSQFASHFRRLWRPHFGVFTGTVAKNVAPRQRRGRVLLFQYFSHFCLILHPHLAIFRRTAKDCPPRCVVGSSILSQSSSHFCLLLRPHFGVFTGTVPKNLAPIQRRRRVISFIQFRCLFSFRTKFQTIEIMVGNLSSSTDLIV